MSNNPNSMRTPMSRVRHLGAAKSGTLHVWQMRATSIALLPLTIAFVWLVLSLVGKPYATVRDTFGSPFPAILTALVLVVGMRHFAMGATTMIEDYARGSARKMLIIFVTCLAWVIAATGLFALARMAL